MAGQPTGRRRRGACAPATLEAAQRRPDRPEEHPMNDYPSAIVPADHVEPVPRRIRARARPARTVLDTTRALLRLGDRRTTRSTTSRSTDVAPSVLVAEGHTQASRPRHRASCTGCASASSTVRAPRGSTRSRRSRAWPAPCASSGTRSTPGSRRTSRSSSTRAAPTRGSTRCARRGACASSSRARARRVGRAGDGLRDRPADAVLPQPHRGRLRAPGGRATRSRRAPTRASPAATGRFASATRSTATSPGPTTSRPASSSRSRGWSPSTTRRSTSSSTAARSSARPRASRRRRSDACNAVCCGRTRRLEV